MAELNISSPVTDLKGAIQIVEDFCASPAAALATANEKKSIPNRPFRRTSKEVEERVSIAGPSEIAAIEHLSDRLDSLNAQLVGDLQPTIYSQGDTEIRWDAISRVGVYVPSRLPATAYTFLSAARAAGVREILLYTAQDGEGNLDPLVLWCARKYNAEISGGPARFGFPVLAFGVASESLQGCSLVCGPCGRAMNSIKQTACLLAGVTSDMSAGPSDLAILADETANWDQISRDIGSQLEHGPDSSAEIVLVGNGAKRLYSANVAHSQDDTLKARITVTHVESVGRGIKRINDIAPETTEVWVSMPAAAERLTTSGVVYERQGSSLGDYGAIGRGCADPTGKRAAAQSGLSPLTFMRTTALVREQQPADALRLGASLLAAYEGLRMHQTAIDSKDMA